jgi:hypothetical protein
LRWTDVDGKIGTSHPPVWVTRQPRGMATPRWLAVGVLRRWEG